MAEPIVGTSPSISPDPPFTIPPAPNTAQNDIDAQIANYYNLVLSLKSQRNTHTPIFRLPADLLVLIFQDVVWVDMDRDPFGWGDHYDDPVEAYMPWRCPAFTQVCRDWRLLSLATPSLWRYIRLTHPLAWMKEQLARSQSYPLTLWHTFNASRDAPLDFLEDPFPYIAFAEPWRVEVIRLNAFGPHLESLTNLRHPHPLLRIVILSSVEVFQMPDDIFGGSAPLLRHLRLINCYPPTSSPAFAGLTELSVTCSFGYSVYLNCTDTLRCLQGIPLLEKLTLHDSRLGLSDLIAGASHTWEGDVHIGRLRTIDIRGHPEYCRFLAHIDCPTISKADIRTFSCHNTTDDFPLRGASRLAAYAAERCPSLHSLKLGVNNLHSTWVIALDAPRTDPLSETTAVFTCEFHAESFPNHTQEQAIVQFFEALPLERLQNLRLAHATDLSSADWHRIFACTPNLSEITISPYSQAFMDAFTNSSAADHTTPLPSLQTLVITAWRTSGETYLRRFDALNAAVEARASSSRGGSGLSKLVIKDCFISEEQIEQLRSIVLVEWDGYERGDHNYSFIPSNEHSDGDDDSRDEYLDLLDAHDGWDDSEEGTASEDENLWS
ncbi:hypothetical protein HGRIS_011787 [Hohenbuehelia grisea]|uniref:F-box domain-containing protein n=1 Tax=Hohenbuehelia grisea TaxID=104357 RepID=A0ABR3JYE0_9AGAR